MATIAVTNDIGYPIRPGMSISAVSPLENDMQEAVIGASINRMTVAKPPTAKESYGLSDGGGTGSVTYWVTG